MTTCRNRIRYGISESGYLTEQRQPANANNAKEKGVTACAKEKGVTACMRAYAAGVGVWRRCCRCCHKTRNCCRPRRQGSCGYLDSAALPHCVCVCVYVCVYERMRVRLCVRLCVHMYIISRPRRTRRLHAHIRERLHMTAVTHKRRWRTPALQCHPPSAPHTSALATANPINASTLNPNP